MQQYLSLETRVRATLTWLVVWTLALFGPIPVRELEGGLEVRLGAESDSLNG